MDLTPETLRSATFRDKLRGYHPDDVDEFLEAVARGLEVLLARLRDTTERARAAQPPPPPPVNPDEAVRTLTLAQRTADLAVREAKQEAERLVQAAQDRANRIVGEAEESARAIAEEAQSELRADLERLQAARDQLSGDVAALGSWLEGERGRIRRALIDVADRVERVKEAGDAPSAKPVKVPAPPRRKNRDRQSAAAQSDTAASGQPRTSPAPAPPATPPADQPAVRDSQPAASERALPRFEPAPFEPSAAPSRDDEAVVDRAQRGMSVETPPADPEPFDDDPYFAELRRAMHDKRPLGPRDDDWVPGDGVGPPQGGTRS